MQGQVAEISAVFGGGVPATPSGRALAPLVPQFNLPRSAFDALIEGVEMDIGSRRYETFEELYEYCIRVASAVGLICLEIFGYDDPRSRQYATDLGVALQLTNILRDVPEDLARGGLHSPGIPPSHAARRRLRGRGPRLERHPLCEGEGLLRQQAAGARVSHKSADGFRGRRTTPGAAEIMGPFTWGFLAHRTADYDVFSHVVRSAPHAPDRASPGVTRSTSMTGLGCPQPPCRG